MIIWKDIRKTIVVYTIYTSNKCYNCIKDYTQFSLGALASLKNIIHLPYKHLQKWKPPSTIWIHQNDMA